MSESPKSEGITISRKNLIIIGAVLGVVVLGVLGFVGVNAIAAAMAEATAAEQERIEAAAEAERRSQLFETAVSACNTSDYTIKANASVRDSGASLYIDGNGGSDFAIYLEAEHTNCILKELGAPTSIFDRMGQTRALDGTLEGEWDDLIARWSYHPDNGLDVIVEFTE